MVEPQLWTLLKLLGFLLLMVFLLWIGVLEMRSIARDRARLRLAGPTRILGSLRSLQTSSPSQPLCLFSAVTGLYPPDFQPSLFPLFDDALVSKVMDLLVFVGRNEVAEILWRFLEDEDVSDLAWFSIAA